VEEGGAGAEPVVAARLGSGGGCFWEDNDRSSWAKKAKWVSCGLEKDGACQKRNWAGIVLGCEREIKLGFQILIQKIWIQTKSLNFSGKLLIQNTRV
jgi:hypothetical protein